MSRRARPVVRLPARADLAPMRAVWVREFTEAAAEQFAAEVSAARQARADVLPILVSSAGGDPYSLLAMVDTLATFPGLVVTIAHGQAMSCGAVLFTCGAPGHRFIAPSATLLLHNVEGNPVGGDGERKRVDADETSRLNVKLWCLMATNIGRPPLYLSDMHKARGSVDWYLSPRDAVEVGIASRVGLPVFDARVRLDPLLSPGG